MQEDRLYSFYKSKEWKAMKAEVMKEHHGECAMCREHGKITRAETVHHVQFVKKYPWLALSKEYTYKGIKHKNLIPLCHDCHDKVHGRMKYKSKKKPLTEEKW